MADTVHGPELEKLRARVTDQSVLFGSWRRERAAKRLAALGTPAAVRTLAEAFVQSADGQVRLIARYALTRLRHQAAIDAVWDVLIMTGNERLAALVAQADYLPSDPGLRAVVLFLNQDFTRYEELDFDGSLLRAAYEAAGPELRQQLEATGRAAGRVEWVRWVTGRQRRRLAELSDDEWATAVKVLVATERWEELWLLAVQAPALWAARMLRALGQHEWQPTGDSEQAGYTKLTALANECAAIPAMARDETTILRTSEEATVFHTPEGATVLCGHAKEITCLAVTPDGRLLASGDYDGIVRLWQLPAGKPAGTLEGHGYRGAAGPRVTSLAVTPDGRLLAGGSNTVQLWRLPSGEPARTLRGHRGHITALAVTPNGSLLASGDRAGGIRLWRLPHGRPAGTLRSHKEHITALVAAPDGELLASSSQDGTVRLWRLPSGKCVGTLKGHRKGVESLAITPDGGLLASSDGGTVRLWRLPSGEPVGTVKRSAERLAMSPDGRILSSDAGTVRLWNLPSDTLTGGLTSYQGSVTCLTVAPDGGLLIGGIDNGAVQLWPSQLWSRLPDEPIEQANGGAPQSWPMWSGLLRKPIGQITPVDLENLGPLDAISFPYRAWAELITTLVWHRHRYDVEIIGATSVIEAGEWDIELDG